MFRLDDPKINKFRDSQTDQREPLDEGLKNEIQEKLLNFPTSLNAKFALSSLDFQKIQPSHFLTNNLNKRPIDDKCEDIAFEKEIDEEREEKEKITLFDLSEEQKTQVKNFKINKVIQNEIYLKKNKILKYLIQIFLCDLLKEKPDDVYEYAAYYFTHPELKQNIASKLRTILNKS
ncbi:hypothetical protein, conserved [Plasmodium gonderi]|uniref:RIIa domain-containing protein n=1 Tax=Plasmodium gonderi TaxID=77519 RepID=A0A1Y1JN60_PLAGO|nr:hypothetical protein, conserved [Plasmodium gonderi]GAW82978.1 hypothetical protein, conserved [Plasmodium gonderi]